jgi:hypothetical protein
VRRTKEEERVSRAVNVEVGTAGTKSFSSFPTFSSPPRAFLLRFLDPKSPFILSGLTARSRALCRYRPIAARGMGKPQSAPSTSVAASSSITLVKSAADLKTQPGIICKSTEGVLRQG